MIYNINKSKILEEFTGGEFDDEENELGKKAIGTGAKVLGGLGAAGVGGGALMSMTANKSNAPAVKPKPNITRVKGSTTTFGK